MNEEILIGRKEIMAALKISYWGTIRDWKRRYNLPIRYLPNNKPMLVVSEVKQWMIVYSRLKKS